MRASSLSFGLGHRQYHVNSEMELYSEAFWWTSAAPRDLRRSLSRPEASSLHFGMKRKVLERHRLMSRR